MKVLRSDNKLWIEIPEDNDGIEICFPNVFRAHYGFAKFEIIADDLEYLLGTMEHYLARLASNALDAELYARMTGNPRWLVYDPETGDSYETPYEVEGAPKVVYRDGKFFWYNPKGGDE